MKDFYGVGVVFVNTHSLLLCFHYDVLYLAFAMVRIIYTFLLPCFSPPLSHCIHYNNIIIQLKRNVEVLQKIGHIRKLSNYKDLVILALEVIAPKQIPLRHT